MRCDTAPVIGFIVLVFVCLFCFASLQATKSYAKQLEEIIEANKYILTEKSKCEATENDTMMIVFHFRGRQAGTSSVSCLPETLHNVQQKGIVGQ